jgi:hypothetical protein
MAINKDRFKKVTLIIIDNLEGGYWNPKWHGVPKGFEKSGETMYGIDRVAGGTLSDTPAGKKFWSKIDSVKTPSVWKHGYLGGSLAPELKNMVVEIMQPVYERNAKKYLSAKAKEIVDNDNRLLFHFIYGSWNGEGWFKKFANDINAAIDKGLTDSDVLVKIALNSRIFEGLEKGSKPNKLISAGGRKINTFIDKLKEKDKVDNYNNNAYEPEKRNYNWLPVFLFSAVLGGVTYYLVNKKIIKI